MDGEIFESGKKKLRIRKYPEPESDSFLSTGSRILFRISFSTVFRYFDLLFCLITIELNSSFASYACLDFFHDLSRAISYLRCFLTIP